MLINKDSEIVHKLIRNYDYVVHTFWHMFCTPFKLRVGTRLLLELGGAAHCQVSYEVYSLYSGLLWALSILWTVKYVVCKKHQGAGRSTAHIYIYSIWLIHIISLLLLLLLLVVVVVVFWKLAITEPSGRDRGRQQGGDRRGREGTTFHTYNKNQY